jgi:hypothetical protein
MRMNFLRATSIACVSLSFLSVAGCSIETDGEDPGDVASVQEALCSNEDRAVCALVCRLFPNPIPNCVEQCLSGCNEPEPPPTWPWTMSCEGSVGTSPIYTDQVTVDGSLQPGSAFPTVTFARELAALATAPCEALMRQYYRNRCSTLDRAGTIDVGLGRTFGGWGADGYSHSYFWGPVQIASIPVADLCPVRTPPPDRPCNRRPCP